VSVSVEIHQWAVENFGDCQLGDVRRTARAVIVAEQMVRCPEASTPRQTEVWKECKALYRLVNRPEVTHAAVSQPHWERTRRMARGTVLLIGDTTETDFGIHRQIDGLGPTGDGDGRGYMLHSSLMVDPQTRAVLGLAGQELFYRKPAPPGENSYQALQRERESEVWGRVVDLVGRPASGVKYIHVFDAGADNLEVFCHLQQQEVGWVVRAAQLQRTVRVEDASQTSGPLQARLKEQPCLGTYTLKVEAGKKRQTRTATLEVRTCQVTINRPKRRTPYLKRIDFRELTQWVVEAREVEPPRGEEPIHWILYTSEPAVTFKDAWVVLEHYEMRWTVEDWHKAIKTACELESRQYVTSHALEVLAAFASIIAVRLVHLRTLAVEAPQTPAENVVPMEWLVMLRALRKHQIPTIRDFIRQLAGLGGFLCRKGDGEPGWITIWHGMDKLLLCVRGAAATRKRCG
jgi:hypothetical protein